MADPEKLGVALFILVVLGASYVVAVYAFADEYLLPATLVYLVVAVVLVGRLLTQKANE